MGDVVPFDRPKSELPPEYDPLMELDLDASMEQGQSVWRPVDMDELDIDACEEHGRTIYKHRPDYYKIYEDQAERDLHRNTLNGLSDEETMLRACHQTLRLIANRERLNELVRRGLFTAESCVITKAAFYYPVGGGDLPAWHCFMLPDGKDHPTSPFFYPALLQRNRKYRLLRARARKRREGK